MGTGPFATRCYLSSYKSAGARPALGIGGWELARLQVIENQSSINSTVPDLCKAITGQNYLHGLLRPILCKCGEI